MKEKETILRKTNTVEWWLQDEAVIQMKSDKEVGAGVQKQGENIQTAVFFDQNYRILGSLEKLSTKIKQSHFLEKKLHSRKKR